MGYVDQFGVSLTAADGLAVEHFDVAVSKLLTFDDDPIGEIDRAIAMNAGFLMAHVVKAVIFILSTEKSQVADAKTVLAAGMRAANGASPRERKHVAALESWLRGQFSAACAMWEEILVDHPKDAVAMFAAHQGDFLLGQSGELRDRVARRLPEIDQGSALEGHYFGMYAFGLEEMGDYANASAVGRRAVERDRRDMWANHALAHVFEMTNRVEEGQHWLECRVNDWSVKSSLAIHTWWHLALYYCDQRCWDQVLELYDTRIRRNESSVTMELVDASALLWRLRLYDVDVGNRWESLAQAWEPSIDDAWYAFNDMHAMMAFAAAGRIDLARRLISVLHTTALASTDNGAMTRAIGLPVSQALLAYAQTRYTSAVDLLGPVRAIAARAGGSHAQRDLLAQTLLSAAEKCGQLHLARALLNERLALRPHSILNRHWIHRVSGLQL